MSNIYWCNDFIGGTPGCLDAISVTDAAGNLSNIPLVVGDACFVVSPVSGGELYVLQDSAGAVEDGRQVIIPDNNVGNLWWKRVQIGVPKDTCVLYVGTVIPDGWTKYDGTTTGFISGGIIRKT